MPYCINIGSCKNWQGEIMNASFTTYPVWMTANELIAKGVLVDDRITYTCQTGLKWSDEEMQQTITCLSSSKWDRRISVECKSMEVKNVYLNFISNKHLEKTKTAKFRGCVEC